jgi:hypothetical protein
VAPHTVRRPRSKQFNDGVTLASYTACTVEPWAARATAFVAWRAREGAGLCSRPADRRRVPPRTAGNHLALERSGIGLGCDRVPDLSRRGGVRYPMFAEFW